MGAAEKSKRDDVLAMLRSPEVKGLFPREMDFRFDAKPMMDADNKPTKNYFLYAIRKERGRENAPIEGDVITSASSGADPTTSEIQVSMSMDRKGAKKWAEMTTKAAQDGNRPIAVVLDDEVVSAPNVNGAITQGRSQITGNFSIQEGEDLANILEIGKLPAKTQIIQEALVGPYLGKKNIKDSMWSLIIGLSLVLLFMVVYYSTGGIVAIIALLANLFFIFGTLASFGTVLTLPGFAGVILTIGMAVDANVIIFERIREELREGKSIKMAVRDGFTHSYSAIIDANVTTLLTAIVLVYFGLGPIKGFAVVLIIGILSSLFTAVLLGRMMIEWWTDKDKPMSFWTGFSKNAFADLKIDWVSKRKIAYVISGVLILASFASFFARGWELGVDFKGGYSYNIQLVEDDKVDVDQLRSTLTDVFEGQEPVVKQVDGPSEYQTLNVTTSYNIDDISEGAAEIVMAKLYEGVKTASNSTVADSVFRDPGGKGLDASHIVSSSKVGATIADDISKGSRYATIFALLLIFLYIFLRFSKWQYSAGAIGALIHDTIIVLGVFSLCYGWIGFSLEINQAFIAALLTVIGYSINDTVVVFDRIREYFGLYTGKSKEEVINAAINSTISRTIITSLTTLFVVAILFLFGGSSIKGFAFALLIGVLVGTYSSIFVATPILTDLTGDLKTKEAGKSKKSSFSKAATSK
jgi:SecD/SecF fusion protein